MITLSWDIEQPARKGSYEYVARLLIKNRQLLEPFIGDRFGPGSEDPFCLHGDHDNVQRTYYPSYVTVDRVGNIVDMGDVYEDYVFCKEHGEHDAFDGSYFWEVFVEDLMNRLESLRLTPGEKATLQEMFPE